VKTPSFLNQQTIPKAVIRIDRKAYTCIIDKAIYVFLKQKDKRTVIMTQVSEFMQQADFKKEKHVPIIETAPKLKKGEPVEVSLSIGKEVSHPNTTQHHIRWISLFFLPDGEQYPIQIGDLIFTAHGSSVQGADSSSVYAHHKGVLVFKTEKPGTLLASSYCNIHGLWESSKKVEISG